MRTAKEMYQYCLKNNFDQGWGEETALMHLKVIEQNLQPDETVLMCFVGKREIMNGKCAFAITNKHVIWGQQNFASQYHKEILFTTITTIRFSGGIFSSMITFSATAEIDGVTCSVKNNSAKLIYDACKKTFEEAKANLMNPVQATIVRSTAADEILKYKKLLDMGAITQEEYEKKKQQLLD